MTLTGNSHPLMIGPNRELLMALFDLEPFSTAAFKINCFRTHRQGLLLNSRVEQKYAHKDSLLIYMPLNKLYSYRY